MIVDNQRILLKRSAARDKYNQPLAQIEYPLPARVVAQTQRVMNPAGEEVITTYTVQIKRAALQASGAQAVRYDDEIVYQDEDGNQHSRKPQTIGGTPGFAGNSFFVRVTV